MLPEDSKSRKEIPLARGLVDYFPDALARVAAVSYAGSKQHHPGEELHWDRSKSTDHADCLLRHFFERGKLDTDGIRHSAKVAWRALAMLQLEIEATTPTAGGLNEQTCMPLKPQSLEGGWYRFKDIPDSSWWRKRMGIIETIAWPPDGDILSPCLSMPLTDFEKRVGNGSLVLADPSPKS
jgi:hypothetical protein